MKYQGPGILILEIDETDAATPAMVYAGKWSSTYDCAVATGYVGSDDEYVLTKVQQQWLAGFEDKVEAAYEKARANNPEYN